ncbi:MFS general substrate transporter [Melanomma pulvis-pyrius CBS 109.77]|uniref:MFS general substrate transporter n=1 Tax=Melanomma pulvis-pyrius CBS 109.77 TaxID=1314802 RepID=A0A6A6WRS5_9PLEO|nr:MFS general substrate transporter [Melanomma pulvis-pyrius CBS 109.77]
MGSLFRDTAAGFFIRYLSRNRFLKYPEELPDFKPPYPVDNPAGSDSSTLSETENPIGRDAKDKSLDRDAQGIPLAEIVSSKLNDIEQTTTRVIHPVQSKNGTILVDWYSTDDPANPYNWSTGRKALVCGQITILTFTVYYGSAAYAPAIPAVMEQFGCSEAVASLGLALYVIGYGFGPLVFSPLSEIPALGRNGLYIATLFTFTLLVIPTTLTNSLPAFMVARFLCAFFGSPPLSTSPASFTDVLPLNKLPYVLALWSGVTTMAPALGPIIAGYTLQTKDWHWSMFELVWIASTVFVFLFFFLPETSADNILLRRAARLRLLTGNSNFRSQSEIKQASMTRNEILFNAVIKPWEMNALDPAILFSTVYVALCYAIFYCFFESFPLVFQAMHGFSLGAAGLTFLSVPIGLAIAIPLQLAHFTYYLYPFLMKHGNPVPEFWLKNALAVSTLAPIGLFIFAWTSSPDIHWIVPLIGVVLFQGAAYQIMNSQFAYIANIYPKYAASLFAANAAARSWLAGGAILFSRPMFTQLGVGGGVSVLGGVMVLCSGLLVVLYFTGHALRKRSRFVST